MDSGKRPAAPGRDRTIRYRAKRPFLPIRQQQTFFYKEFEAFTSLPRFEAVCTRPTDEYLTSTSVDKRGILIVILEDRGSNKGHFSPPIRPFFLLPTPNFFYLLMGASWTPCGPSRKEARDEPVNARASPHNLFLSIPFKAMSYIIPILIISNQ